MQWMAEAEVQSGRGAGPQRARRILHSFQQEPSSFVPLHELVIMLYTLREERIAFILDSIAPGQMPSFHRGLLAHMRTSHPDTLASIEGNLREGGAQVLSPTDLLGLRLAVAEYAFQFAEQAR